MTRRGTYTPGKTLAYESHVRLAASVAMAGGALMDGPLMLEVLAHFPTPKSWSKKRKEATYRHTSKPDIDNIVKSIMDGCEGVVFQDDRQVSTLLVRKSYGTPPQVKVKIEQE